MTRRFLSALILSLCTVLVPLVYAPNTHAMSLDEYCDRLNSPGGFQRFDPSDIDPRFVNVNFTEKLVTTVETNIMQRFNGIQACMMNEVDYAFDASIGRMMRHIDRMSNVIDDISQTFVQGVVDTAKSFRDRIACTSASIAGSTMGKTGIVEDVKESYDEIYAYYDGVVAIKESAERVNAAKRSYTGDPVVDRRVQERIDEEHDMLRQHVDDLPVMDELDETQRETRIFSDEISSLSYAINRETQVVARRMSEIQNYIREFSDILNEINEYVCKDKINKENEDNLTADTLILQNDGCDFMRQEINHQILCEDRILIQINDRFLSTGEFLSNAVPYVNPDDGCNEIRQHWNQRESNEICIRIVSKEIDAVPAGTLLDEDIADGCSEFRKAHNEGKDIRTGLRIACEGEVTGVGVIGATGSSIVDYTEDTYNNRMGQNNERTEVEECLDPNIAELMRILGKIQDIVAVLSTLEEIEQFYKDIEEIKELYTRTVELIADINLLVNDAPQMLESFLMIIDIVKTLASTLSALSGDLTGAAQEAQIAQALLGGELLLDELKIFSGFVCDANEAINDIQELESDINDLSERLEADMAALEDMSADASDVWDMFKKIRAMSQDERADAPDAENGGASTSIDESKIVETQEAIDLIKENGQALRENAEAELSWWREGTDFLLNDVFSNENISAISNLGDTVVDHTNDLLGRIPMVADLTRDALDALWEMEYGEAACRARGDSYIPLNRNYVESVRRARDAKAIFEHSLKMISSKQALLNQQMALPISEQDPDKISSLQEEITTHQEEYDRYLNEYTYHLTEQENYLANMPYDQQISEINRRIAETNGHLNTALDPDIQSDLEQEIKDMEQQVKRLEEAKLAAQMAYANPDILTLEGGICVDEDASSDPDATLQALRDDFSKKAYYVCEIQEVTRQAIDAQGNGSNSNGFSSELWDSAFNADLARCMGDVGVFDGLRPTKVFTYTEPRESLVISGERYKCSSAKAGSYWREAGATASSIFGQYDDINALVQRIEGLGINDIMTQVENLQYLIDRASNLYSYIGQIDRLVQMIQRSDEIFERGLDAFNDIDDELKDCIPTPQEIADDIITGIEDTVRDYIMQKLVGLFGRAGEDLSYFVLPSSDYRPGDPLEQWLDDYYFNAETQLDALKEFQTALKEKPTDTLGIQGNGNPLALAGLLKNEVYGLNLSHKIASHAQNQPLLESIFTQPQAQKTPWTDLNLVASDGINVQSDANLRLFESYTGQKPENIITDALHHAGRTQTMMGGAAMSIPLKANIDFAALADGDLLSALDTHVDLEAILELPKVKFNGSGFDFKKNYGDDFSSTLHLTPESMCKGGFNLNFCWYRIYVCFRSVIPPIELCIWLPIPIPIPEVTLDYKEPVAHVEISARQGTSYLGNMMLHNFADTHTKVDFAGILTSDATIKRKEEVKNKIANQMDPLLTEDDINRSFDGTDQDEGINWSTGSGYGVQQARVWGIPPQSRSISGLSPVGAPMTFACDIAHGMKGSGEKWDHLTLPHVLAVSTAPLHLFMSNIATPLTKMNQWRKEWFQPHAPMIGVAPYALAALYISEENKATWNPRVNLAPSIFGSNLGENEERYEEYMGVPFNPEAIKRHIHDYRKEFFTEYVTISEAAIPSEYGNNKTMNIDWFSLRQSIKRLENLTPELRLATASSVGFLLNQDLGTNSTELSERIDALIDIAKNNRKWNKLKASFTAKKETSDVNFSAVQNGLNNQDVRRQQRNQNRQTSDTIDKIQRGVNQGLGVVQGGLDLVQDGLSLIDDINPFGQDVCVESWHGLCRNKCDVGIQDQTNICLGNWGALFPRNGHTFLWDYTNPLKTMALLGYRAFDRALEQNYIQPYKMQEHTGPYGKGYREGHRWSMSFEWPIQTRTFRVGDDLSELRWHPDARKARRAGMIATMWKDTTCCIQSCMNPWPFGLGDKLRTIDVIQITETKLLSGTLNGIPFLVPGAEAAFLAGNKVADWTAKKAIRRFLPRKLREKAEITFIGDQADEIIHVKQVR